MGFCEQACQKSSSLLRQRRNTDKKQHTANEKVIKKLDRKMGHFAP